MMADAGEQSKFDPSNTENGPVRHPSGDRSGPLTLGGAGEAARPTKIRLAGDRDRALAAHRAEMLDRWSHKNEGTPETLEHASNREQSSIARMFMAGDINQDQLAWAEEIGVAAEMIERDVQVKISSYIPRIDCSAGSRDVLVEGILAVRREIAYTRWRGMIPDPKRAILDMLVGEPKSFSAVAKMYRMHKRRAKALLIRAIDIWPDAMSFAEKEADAASLAAAHAGLI